MARFREERIPWDSQPQEWAELSGPFIPKYFWISSDGLALRGGRQTAVGTNSGTKTVTQAGLAFAHNGTSQLENWIISEANSGYPIIIGGSFVVTQTSTANQTAVGVGGATLAGGNYGGVGQYTAGTVGSWLRAQTGISDAPINGPTAVIGQRYNVVRVSRSATDHVMYVNGVRYSSSTSSGTPNDSWLNFSIGASNRATTPVFYGRQSVHMGFFDRVDPGEEWMREWSLNEWSIFEPQSIPVYVAGAVSGNTISVPTGALTLSALAPTVAATANQNIGVPAGALTLAGYAPVVTSAAGQTIAAPAGVLTLAAYAPSVTASTNYVSVPKGALTITGHAPTVLDGAAGGFTRYFDVLSGNLLILRAL